MGVLHIYLGESFALVEPHVVWLWYWFKEIIPNSLAVKLFYTHLCAALCISSEHSNGDVNFGVIEDCYLLILPIGSLPTQDILQSTVLFAMPYTEAGKLL